MEKELKCKFCRNADLILSIEWACAFETFNGDALVRALNKKYFLKNLKARLCPEPPGFKLYCPHCRRNMRRVLVAGKEQSVRELMALVVNPVVHLPHMEVVLKPISPDPLAYLRARRARSKSSAAIATPLRGSQ